MKVLMINGSPHKKGALGTAFEEMEKVFKKNGIDYEILQVGGTSVRGCTACDKCYELGKCVFDDLVNVAAEKLKDADALVVGAPVYYAGANGSLVSFMDRLFYSTQRLNKRFKVGAAVVSCRRGGASSSFDGINKYFTIAGMPVASSQYWNSIHGNNREEALQDLEGLQTMRTLAENISFLIKSIALGKEKYGCPEREKLIFTNFVR